MRRSVGGAVSRHSLGLPPLVPGLRIGLLGGSFDPPHEGHVQVTEWAFRRLALNQVWWLVAARNPLKDRLPAGVRRRIQAARECVTDPRITVTDLEIRIGSVHTAVTLEFLKKKYPLVRFVWLMGSDNLEGFRNWHRWRDIVQSMPVAVFPRPGHRVSAICHTEEIWGRHRVSPERSHELAGISPPAWTLLSMPLCGRSSTAIRFRGGWNE